MSWCGPQNGKEQMRNDVGADALHMFSVSWDSEGEGQGAVGDGTQFVTIQSEGGERPLERRDRESLHNTYRAHVVCGARAQLEINYPWESLIRLNRMGSSSVGLWGADGSLGQSSLWWPACPQYIQRPRVVWCSLSAAERPTSIGSTSARDEGLRRTWGTWSQKRGQPGGVFKRLCPGLLVLTETFVDINGKTDKHVEISGLTPN